MPEAGPEIPRVEELIGEIEAHHRHDRYGKFIAVAIVVTTLIGALVAFAQGAALRKHDTADARAESYGTLALEASAVARGHDDAQVSRLNLTTEQVRAANNATLFARYGSSPTVNKLTAARWNAIAHQTEADTEAIARSQGVPFICSPSIQSHCPAANAAYSPEQDPRFPSRYMQLGQWSAYRLTALREASNQAADDAEAQFVHYAAALTMLAVAVFLFGYSLTPQGRQRRRLYAYVAGVLVLLAGVWAAVQVLSPVTTPPVTAAAAYANGQVALGDGAYRAAIKDFDQAIRQSPRFVDAYVDRAQAEFGAGFPVTGTGESALPTTAGPVTIPATSALDAAIRDDEQAHIDGSDSATLLLDLGRDLFYRGLINHSTADLRASRDDLDQGVRDLRTQDNAATLLASAYLRMAADDVALAHSAISDLRDATTALRAPNVAQETIVATGLTDLSLIESRDPKLTSQAENAAAQIVAAGELGAQTPTGKTGASNFVVNLTGVSASPDPGHALYVVKKYGNFNPNRDVISAQWEYKDPLHGEWAILPELSGPVVPGGVEPIGAGFASSNTSYVSNSHPATCLPEGRYRVELYVNGHLSGTATANGNWSALHAVRFSTVDGAMCVPPGWLAVNVGAGAGAYIAPGATAGTLIFSIPKATLGPSNNEKGLASLMETLVRSLSGSGGLLPNVQSTSKPSSTPFFMSSSNGQYEQWTWASGQVLSGVGTSTNGQVYVGVAWGPSRGRLVQELFLSLSPL
jgi:tetratricopeptide (TPR) repeat protein